MAQHHRHLPSCKAAGAPCVWYKLPMPLSQEPNSAECGMWYVVCCLKGLPFSKLLHPCHKVPLALCNKSSTSVPFTRHAVVHVSVAVLCPHAPLLMVGAARLLVSFPSLLSS